jgi:hypothetical protein
MTIVTKKFVTVTIASLPPQFPARNGMATQSCRVRFTPAHANVIAGRDIMKTR